MSAGTFLEEQDKADVRALLRIRRIGLKTDLPKKTPQFPAGLLNSYRK